MIIFCSDCQEDYNIQKIKKEKKNYSTKNPMQQINNHIFEPLQCYDCLNKKLNALCIENECLKKTIEEKNKEIITLRNQIK